MLKKFIYFLLLLLLVMLGWMLWYFKMDVPVEKLKAKYAPPPSKFLDLNGMQVHYRDEGQGMPLVLVHGTGASLHTWQPWTEGLTGTFRVIRMDMPAFGLTGPDPKANYTIQAYVAFLEQFLTQLQIDSCYIAGNSLGGNIAWHYAAAFPQKVKKLILIDAAGYPSAKPSPLPFRMARTTGINLISRYVTPRFFFLNNLKNVYADHGRINDALVDRYYELMLREGNRQAFIDRAKTPFEDDSHLIKSIKCPTLILWGKEDSWIPVSFGEQFHKDIAQSQLIVYPHAGHIPMEEIPTETLKDALQFLK